MHAVIDFNVGMDFNNIRHMKYNEEYSDGETTILFLKRDIIFHNNDVVVPLSLYKSMWLVLDVSRLQKTN